MDEALEDILDMVDETTCSKKHVYEKKEFLEQLVEELQTRLKSISEEED